MSEFKFWKTEPQRQDAITVKHINRYTENFKAQILELAKAGLYVSQPFRVFVAHAGFVHIWRAQAAGFRQPQVRSLAIGTISAQDTAEMNHDFCAVNWQICNWTKII